MIVFGAYLGLMGAGENKSAYIYAVVGGLKFAFAPLAAAIFLLLLYKLVTWPFRR